MEKIKARMREIKEPTFVDAIIFCFIFIFLAGFFDPISMFSKTITTGGDTGSHYYTAVYLKEVLLPEGKIMGWMQGNYAGFPLFYHYFPLPFIIMALLSYVIPLQVAFKLVTVIGIFLLPVSVYLSFRLLKYAFPIPILGALFTLPFLFMEANSMWGANIPSTLAGEFSYSIGISLLFLFLGTLYAGIHDKNKIILNACLVFLMGLSHGYALIFSGVIGTYFLFSRKSFWKNFKYLFLTFGLGFLLLGFWLLPFIETLPWVTEFVTAWKIKSFFEVFPRIILPFSVFSLGALALNFFDRRTGYFLYNIIICSLLYFIGPRIGVLDIRFIPILQIFLCIFGATFILDFLKEIKNKPMLPFILMLSVVLWVSINLTFIKGWVLWNYSGFEGKKDWGLFQQINHYLNKNGNGRVIYEHSPLHNIFGTERAFESLPLFAKRDTLEGLYMQSSISSPFIFYLQSEISKVHSGPFPQYQDTQLNLPAALPQLKLFNVSQYIVRTPEAKKAAANVSALKLEKRFGEYEIYRLIKNDGHYVIPLTQTPRVIASKNWKMDFFNWFRSYREGQSHLVLEKLPNKTFTSVTPKIKEALKNEEVIFETNLIGYPHLIKVSYHPNWQVEGADKIYLVSPSFMLVYPKANRVRLYFGKNFYNYTGEGLTLLGLSILLFSGIIYLKNVRRA